MMAMCFVDGEIFIGPRLIDGAMAICEGKEDDVLRFVHASAEMIQMGDGWKDGWRVPGLWQTLKGKGPSETYERLNAWVDRSKPVAKACGVVVFR